jgi:hypothetical protein
LSIILVIKKRILFISLVKMVSVATYGMFSYERRKCLKEKQADISFNQQSKQFCYVFYQHTDDAYILGNASVLTAVDFVKEEDVYIVDREFNWTYVRTHETGWCGPYFSRKNN